MHESGNHYIHEGHKTSRLMFNNNSFQILMSVALSWVSVLRTATASTQRVPLSAEVSGSDMTSIKMKIEIK